MKYLLSIVFAAAMLSGCASGNNGGAGSPVEQPAQNEPEEEAIPNEEQNVEPEQEAQPEELETPDIAHRYRMNGNFDIKPVDDSAPGDVVLLTFDDGPKEEAMLLHMLDTLDQHGAKAIFFVNGYRVKSNPELLKLIHERGQYIGNHAWDHLNLKQQSEEEVDRQLESVQDIVEQLTGQRPAFFRPPFGAGNDYVKAKARELGMLYMTWSNGSLDWADNQHDPDGVIRSVLEQLRPGSNILMHELQWTAEALDGLLTALQEQGYGFVDPGAIETEETATP